MWAMRRSAVHALALPISALALYLGATGTLIELVDLRSVLFAVPATDPNLRAMRESLDGPDDFKVRTTADYVAPPLTAGMNFARALDTVMTSARAQLGRAPLNYVEFRMDGGRPVGRVGLARGYINFDARTGALASRREIDLPEPAQPVSTRNTLKQMHRMSVIGDAAAVIDIIAGIGLSGLFGAGMVMVFRRRSSGFRFYGVPPTGLVAKAATRLWKVVVFTATSWLTVIALSGTWLAVESVGLAFYFARNSGPPPAVRQIPISDAKLPGMLAVTLSAGARDAANEPIKVLRLRYYAGYPQGVIVTGGRASRQLVFNATTGVSMSMTEPGYPEVPFPFGWQAHQDARRLHRGELFGLTGQFANLISGIALLCLALFGLMDGTRRWWRRHRPV